MLCLSSKKSLLSGASAVVLATTVGVSAVGVSGALAQAVEYTHNSAGIRIWGGGGGTAGDLSDVRNANPGDNLTLEGGDVRIYDTYLGSSFSNQALEL